MTKREDILFKREKTVKVGVKSNLPSTGINKK
jgi:hypothetical protein